jgi:hypothetical protein
MRTRGGMSRGAGPPGGGSGGSGPSSVGTISPGSSSLPSSLQSRGISVTSNRRPAPGGGPDFGGPGGVKRRILDGSFQCQLCDKPFGTKGELQDHLVTLHAGSQEPLQLPVFNLHNINHVNHLNRIGVEFVMVDKNGKRALPVFRLSNVKAGVNFDDIKGLQFANLS